MDYRVRLHELAEAELDQIYDDIVAEAGPVTAGTYVGGLYDLIAGFATFAERGTVREGPVRDYGSSATAVPRPLLSSWMATR